MSRSVSVTAAGQCRLAPLIQVILDCSHLYDYTVKLLFKLHSCEYPLCLPKSQELRGVEGMWGASRLCTGQLRAPTCPQPSLLGHPTWKQPGWPLSNTQVSALFASLWLGLPIWTPGGGQVSLQNACPCVAVLPGCPWSPASSWGGDAG